MTSHKSDPGSLSFGAHLQNVELKTAGNKRKVQELQKTALDEEQKRNASERRWRKDVDAGSR